MLLNGQNIDPQESIYRYNKSTQEIINLPWTKTKPIKVDKKLNKAFKTKEKIIAMFRQHHTDIEICEALDVSLGYVRKVINSL